MSFTPTTAPEASGGKRRSRRSILLAAAGGLALVGAGATWRVTRRPEAALQPWQANRAARAGDFRLETLRYAVLAPNPHNRQPWRIRLDGSHAALLFCGLDRRLPETDPLDRQIVIGLGCFAELAAIAATQDGRTLDIESFPEGVPAGRLDRRPVARLSWRASPGLAVDPLFPHILARRSAKVPYDLTRPIPPTDFERLTAPGLGSLRLAGSRTEPEVAALRALVWRGMELEFLAPAKLKESIDLLRVGSREIEAHPDGIPLQGPFFEALSLLGGDAVRAQAMDTNSSAFRSTAERYRTMFAATPAFLWIVSSGSGLAEAFDSGRAYLRQNLIATALGLSMHPVSQALQEYPEMAALHSEAKRLCGVKPGETLQMLARLGYSSPVAPAPRWPLEAKLIA